MRIYESLGTASFEFDPTELWDDDDDKELSEHGKELVEFLADHNGPFSIDFSGSLSSPVTACLDGYFEQHGWKHKVPVSQEEWEDIASLMYYIENNSLEDAASVYYRLILGDDASDVLNNTGYDREEFYPDTEFESLAELKGKELVEDALDEHGIPTDEILSQISGATFHKVAKNQYNFYPFCDGVIVTDNANL
jgi:hypothetical protein